MSELTPKELALLETVRSEWGPDDVPPPAPEAALRARLAEKPWLRGAELAPASSRFGRLAAMAIVVIGACSLGYFTLRGGVPTRSSGHEDAVAVAPPSPDREVAPSSAPTAVNPPAAETTTIEALPDAPRGLSRAGGPTGETRGGAKVAERAPERARVTSPSSSPPPPPAPTGAPATQADTLADELALIRSAQGALRDGASDRALSTLASHASQFPRGVLRDERMTLQALALCARGDVATARSVRRELERSSPGSSHLQRLANSCAAGDP